MMHRLLELEPREPAAMQLGPSRPPVVAALAQQKPRELLARAAQCWPIPCNPRYLHTVRRVAPSQADMWSRLAFLRTAGLGSDFIAFERRDSISISV